MKTEARAVRWLLKLADGGAGVTSFVLIFPDKTACGGFFGEKYPKQVGFFSLTLSYAQST